jgi:hypothetical protein
MAFLVCRSETRCCTVALPAFGALNLYFAYKLTSGSVLQYFSKLFRLLTYFRV